MHVLGRLTVLDVMESWGEKRREKRTDRRVWIAEKTAFAGGNTLGQSVSDKNDDK